MYIKDDTRVSIGLLTTVTKLLVLPLLLLPLLLLLDDSCRSKKLKDDTCVSGIQGRFTARRSFANWGPCSNSSSSSFLFDGEKQLSSALIMQRERDAVLFCFVLIMEATQGYDREKKDRKVLLKINKKKYKGKSQKKSTETLGWGNILMVPP